MSQIVVDTDVALYIFNWHSKAPQYVDALRGSELILSFVSIAEMRMAAMAAYWEGRRRVHLERFIRGFGAVFPDDALCTSWALLRANARAAGRSLTPHDAWVAATALALDAPLATGNRIDFEQVENLKLVVAGGA